MPTRREGQRKPVDKSRSTVPLNDGTEPSSNDRNRTHVGRTWGRYQVVERIGSGTFGAVYRAHDPHLGRDVALKVPHKGQLPTAEAVQRFRREALAAARLRHPHIVPVFDVGKDDGRHYLTAAFIRGETLEAAFDNKRVTPHRAAVITLQLADAVNYAHAQGVVHRDIKPANVLLDENGEPHLTDFGVARLAGIEEKLTRDGTILGTPAYMSPEQASGGTATGLSDQYSLGIVLYEGLTGRVPFEGPVEACIFQILNEDPVPPRLLHDETPRDLETICLKAIAKRPDDRFADCGELADDLRRWLMDEPIQARRQRLGERVVRWVGREPVIALMAVLIMLVAAAGFVGVSMALGRAKVLEQAASESATSAKRARRQAEQSRKAADREKRGANQSLGFAMEASQDASEARRQAARDAASARAASERADKAEQEAAESLTNVRRAQYQTNVQMAYREWEINNLDYAESLLDDCPEDLRDWEWYYCKRLMHLEFLSLQHESNVNCVAIVPPTETDGPRILTGCDDGTISLWIFPPGLRTKMWKHNEPITDIAVTNAGRQFISAGPQSTTLWTLASDVPQAIEPSRTLNGESVAAKEGDDLLISGSSKGIIGLGRSSPKDDANHFDGHAARVTDVAFFPHGRSAISVSLDQAIKVWDADTGDLLGSTSLRSPIHGLAMHPQQPQWWLAATDDGVATIEIIPQTKTWMMRGSIANGIRTPDHHITAVRQSPLAKRSNRLDHVAYAAHDGDVFYRSDGSSEPLRIRGNRGAVRSMAFLWRGRYLVTATGQDSTAKVWDLRADYAERKRVIAGTHHVVAGKHRVAVGLRKWTRKTVVNRKKVVRTDWLLSQLDRPPGSERVGSVHIPEASDVAISRDGKRFALACPDKLIVGRLIGERSDLLSQLSTSVKTAVETDNENTRWRTLPAAAESVAFSFDGDVVFAMLTPNLIARWEVESGKKLAELSLKRTSHCFACCPNENRIAVGHAAGTIEVRELIDDSSFDLMQHGSAVRALAFSRNGRRLASLGDDRVVRIWDWKRRREVFQLHIGGAPRERCRSLFFSAEGRKLVAAFGDQMTVWEAGKAYPSER